jgi:hypothetical protein
VNNVWQTRRRLLIEKLDELADQLRSDEPIAPTVQKEHTIRLLVGMVMLLRQHNANKRGHCRICRQPRSLWQPWRRQSQCTIYRSVDFAMRQPLDIVQWQLFEDRQI